MRRRFPISNQVVHAATLAGVLLLGIAQGSAQITPPPQKLPGDDPFAEYHRALTNSADSLLAAPAQGPSDALKNTPQTAALTEAAGGKASEASQAVDRVRRLRPVLEPILREEHVPTELAAVVLIESGGVPTALSPKGARGIWQFMPDTARRYGLIVTPERDERLDVYRSTHAAARYLRDLHEQFRDWRLAFAAYNAGEDVVQHAIERNRTRDFSKLSSGHSIPLETRRYVPAVVDAMGILGRASSVAGATWTVYADAELSNW